MSSSHDSSSSQPLLPNTHRPSSEDQHRPTPSPYKPAYQTLRLRVRAFLSSRAQHYTVLSLVSCDLLGIFADIIINLYQCDVGTTYEVWDRARDGLGIAGLVFSCLFMLELLLSVWAFGLRYFSSKFHCFDALVILAGFITDVLLHGVLEEVASLVVILRLWRFFKIIEEFSVGAEEQMEGLERRIELLEKENGDLKRKLDLGGGMGKGMGMGDEEEARLSGGSAGWE